MFFISYTPKIRAPQFVKNIGALVEESKRITINFAVLEDAFEAANAVKSAGCFNVYVSDQEDPDRRYMIPKQYR